MKKAILAVAIAVSAVALASTTESANAASTVKQVYQDTVPGKKDTTSWPKPDTTKTPPAIFQLAK